MSEKPILFSAPMVRALLDGTKTQTRRAMKHQPGDEATVTVEHFNQAVIDRHGDEQPGPEVFGAWWADGECGIRCPYGQPSDQLWVREAWRTVTAADGLPPRDLSRAHRIWYEADSSLTALRGLTEQGKLRPSMFMPRWASRITLEITGVRVERLQDISAADALAEGIKITFDPKTKAPLTRISGKFPPANYIKGNGLVIAEYASLWEQINGAGSWDKNPWVWVVSFKRIEAQGFAA